MPKYYRNIHIELLRCIACFLVLFNHTSYSIIKIAPGDLSKSRVVTLTLYFLCKAAVPLFLLIAGTNLLNKNDTPSKYIKRILKTIILIVGGYLFYCLADHQNPFTAKQLYKLYNGEYNASVWYLYLYLGILFLLPILQSIHLSNKQYIYFLVIYLAGPGLFPLLHHYFSVPLPATPIFYAFPSGYIALFLFGNFVGNQLDINTFKKSTLIFIWTGLVISIVLSFILAIYQLNTLGEIKYSSIYGTTYYTFTIVISLCIFLLIRYYFNHISNSLLQKAIRQLGRYTLGIYILGEFIRVKLEFIYDNLKKDMSELLAVLIYTTCIFVSGVIIMFIFYSVKDFICKQKR